MNDKYSPGDTVYFLAYWMDSSHVIYKSQVRAIVVEDRRDIDGSVICYYKQRNDSKRIYRSFKPEELISEPRGGYPKKVEAIEQ